MFRPNRQNPRRSAVMIAAVPVAAALVTSSFLPGATAAVRGSRIADRSMSRITTRAAAPIRFSHAVVVDEQRPGFEPDVKVDGKGVIYSSVPFGFSTTQSFVWSSRDHGNSYQLTPGNIGPGKPTTCAGGGDTDLFLDSKNALYFSDLQGLTNISVSMSTDGGATWTTNCASAPNTPDDRMWFAGTGSSAGGNLKLYQDFDAVDGALPSGGNQLVETVSTDGTHFQPVVNTDGLTSGCTGAATNCVTDNEGISGNQVVDPATGNVYISHTTINGNSAGNAVGVQVSEGKITSGTPTTGSWTESPNLDAALCPDKTCVDKSGNAEELAGENFASIARDSAGYLYVAFTAGAVDHKSSSDPNFGALTAPEQIYVVHSLTPAGKDPSKLTWSAPTKITGSGPSAGTNTFPWITAGSDGRVDVAWYHTAETSEKGTCASGTGTCTLYGAGNLSKAEWSVQLGQSLDAHATSPSYTAVPVSEAPVKHGQICTNGLGCTTGGDRSLGDFLQVTTDSQGAAVVSYVFDTSADTSAGENAGPEVISRQISGPSLLASVGQVSQGSGPGLAMDSASDPTGDAFYSANGSRTAATPNLDLTGASLVDGPNSTLTATIKVHSLASLAASPQIGGPDASWLIRWTMVTPGKTGNGDIFYAGMDNNAGTGGSGTPSFFVGNTAGIPPANPEEHTKYITFPQTDVLKSSQASYNAKSGVITLHIPLADVGKPAMGTTLYSVTAFSATSTSPQSATNIFNLIDATTPFDTIVAPVPVVSGLSPRQGPVAGGTKVTITGSGFVDVSGVSFGSAAAKSFSVVSPTEIVATTPPGHAGAVDVRVAAAGGVTPTGIKDLFTYIGQAALEEGYWLLASDGGIFTFGHAHFWGSAPASGETGTFTAIAGSPDGRGYWLVTSAGKVDAFGSAESHGSVASGKAKGSVVGIAVTPDGSGYWLTSSTGQVFDFGSSRSLGSAGVTAASGPAVAIAATPDGRGYWITTSKGWVFRFGDAGNFGSLAAHKSLRAPIVGLAAIPDGLGYWLVASDGGVFTFGRAAFFGSAGAIRLKKPIVGMASSPDGRGYWLDASDGGVFTYGDARFFGSTGALVLKRPMVAMAPSFSS